MDERKKLLAKTMGDIEKKFGKGSIMQLGEKPVEPIETISTGSYMLNDALGVNGLPKGRIVEIYGPESSGKCLTEDTNILTPFGYKTIKEIFNENALKTECVSKTIEVNYPLINKDGEVEYTTHFTFNGRKPVYRIKTNTGLEIKGTAKHPLCVLNKYGLMVWKYCSEIEEGDILVGRKGDYYFSDIKSVSEDEAILLGLLIADGYIDKDIINFSTDIEELEKFFKENIHNIEEFQEGKVNLHTYMKEDGGILYHVDEKEQISRFYRRLGYIEDKIVPRIILRSHIDIQKAFLKGYFDSKADINEKNKTIEVSTTFFRPLKQIQMMLRNMGIVSILEETDENWKLSIHSYNIDKYYDEIGFISKDNTEKIKKILTNKDYLLEDKVPNIDKLVISYWESLNKDERRKSERLISNTKVKKDGISKKILIDLLGFKSGNEQLRSMLEIYTDENLHFEIVKETEELEGVPTFDFAMEKTHTFIGEGIINHNTTLCLHAIAEAQKAGGIGAIVDAEHALDPIYARNLGINIEDLIVSQPDTGEEALEIVEHLVRSGVVDIIVVDSVAALVPKAEIEGDMGQSHVGLQARLMSQALRKLTGAVSKSNCIVIFINQIREKVGIMFGSPETTTGGRALKFYSSVRMDIRRIDSIKNGTEIIGNRTRVKVVKNKVAPPFTQAEFDIIYGKGIDSNGELVDLAVEKGIIKKAGAWYSYGEHKWQGRENTKQFLIENSELMDEIEKKLFNKEESEDTNDKVKE